MQDIYPISIKDLINHANIFDKITTSTVEIYWKFPDGKRIRNCENTFLINRVIGVPDDLFNDFEIDDQNYAKAEFRAYLTFSLSVFPNSFGIPSPFGLFANRYSLPRQWDMVDQMLPELTTPRYFLGDLSQYTNEPGLVCSNPFDYYFWRPTIKESSFGFIKPTGEPIVSCLIGDSTTIFPHNKDYKITDEVSIKIKNFSQKISETFSFDIFEALFFVDNHSFTFGMASPIPYFSAKTELFEKNIINYFSQKTK